MNFFKLQSKKLQSYDKDYDDHVKDFLEKRKLHYNEFYACKLAKDHLVHESDEDEDDEDYEDEESKRFSEEASLNARLNANLFRSYGGSNDVQGGSSSKN